MANYVLNTGREAFMNKNVYGIFRRTRYKHAAYINHTSKIEP